MPNGNRDLKKNARALAAETGILYTQALSIFKAAEKGDSAEYLEKVWRSFLMKNLRNAVDLFEEDGSGIKTRTVHLEDGVSSIQLYVETAAGNLHISNIGTSSVGYKLKKKVGDGTIPAIFCAYPDESNVCLWLEDVETGKYSQGTSLASTPLFELFASRLAGMFDIAYERLEYGGAKTIEDALPESSEGWNSSRLQSLGMLYCEGEIAGIGKGLYDQRYETDGDDWAKRIFVSRLDQDLDEEYEPVLGEPGTEDLLLWVPNGDYTYRYVPVPREGTGSIEFRVYSLIRYYQDSVNQNHEMVDEHVILTREELEASRAK